MNHRLRISSIILLYSLPFVVNSCSKAEKVSRQTDTRSDRQPMIVDGIIVGYAEYERTITVPGTILPNEWV